MPRPSGSKNKITKELKDTIKKLLEGNYDKFESELNQLSGKQYVDIYIRMLEYIIPKAKEDLTQLQDYEAPKIIIEYTNE